jgi:hypothetical protein
MRHWLWHTSTGAIGGEEIINGGWNPALDFNDPASSDGTVQAIRAMRVGKQDFAGFVAFDCPCPEATKWCDCARQQTDTKHVDLDDAEPDPKKKRKRLSDKPGFAIVIDGEQLRGNGMVRDKAPGVAVMVKLVGAVPDGTVVRLVEHPANLVAVLQTSPAILTFAGGETNTVTLTSPGKGFVARMGLHPQDRRVSSNRGFRIRGW